MKRLKAVFTCFLLLWITPGLVFAQTGTIEGQVTDAQDGAPLPGVNVVIQELGRGAATGPEGHYSMQQVPAGDHVVTARFVGYRMAQQEVSLSEGETLTLNFELEEEALGLDEMVVTGTGGEVERRSLGNTVARMDFSGVENIGASTLTDAMAGREPGVNINVESGALDQEPRIRIRGTASLSMTNEPLVYVDGVRVSSRGGFAPGVGAGGLGAPSGLANLNYDAIERVEILKGPAAATLYGSQANAGVIQIFTKQGAQESAPRFRFQVSNTFHQMPDRFRQNAGFVRDAESQQRVRDILGVDVDLYEPFESPVQLIDLYGLGMGQEVSGSVQGGGQGATYYANLRYSQSDGPFKPDASVFNGGAVGGANDAYQRFYWTGNLNIIPSGKVRVNLQTNYTHSDNQTYGSGITIYTPTSSARYSKPERVGLVSEYDTFGLPFFATPREGTYPEIYDQSNRGKVVLQGAYLPIEQVTLDAQIGFDYSEQRSEDYTPFGYTVDGVGPNPLGSLTVGTRTRQVWSFESKMNWSADFTDEVSSTFVTGFQAYQSETETSVASGDNFPGPGLRTVDATNIQSANSSFQEVVDAGLFVQEQLGYQRALYLTLGVRLDASSAFGEEFNYATYPKIGVSFIPLEFLDASLPGVSGLQLRGAWGRSGQQPGAFDRFTTYIPVNSPEGSGVVTGNLGNPELRPEVASEWEVGFEAALFQNRVSVTGTYWDRTTDDALIDRSYAPSGGFVTPQLTNLGQVQARGLEFGLDGDVLEQDNFSLNAFANIAYLYEHVSSLGGSPSIKVDAGYVRDRMFIKEGYAPGSYFGTKLPEGVAFPLDLEQNGEISSQNALQEFFSQPRDPSELTPFIMVAGPDGNPMRGGEYYTDHYLGKQAPDWEGSAGLSAQYGGFTLSTRFSYAFGNFYHHNLTDAFRRTNSGIGRNIMESASLEAVLVNPASSAQDRMAAAQDWVNNMVSLTPFDGLNEIERADYLRWQNLTLSYRLPESVTGNFGINNASITLRGSNLALWSKYGGVDPTATGEGSLGGQGGLYENFAGGMDTYGTPQLRTYTVTLSMGF